MLWQYQGLSLVEAVLDLSSSRVTEMVVKTPQATSSELPPTASTSGKAPAAKHQQRWKF